MVDDVRRRRLRAPRRLLLLGVVAALVLLASGCELAPTPVIVVTTTADGRDAVPGDGVCETTVGTGVCTLAAAVDEANALGRAHLVVPAGTYGEGFTVTGDVGINVGDPRDVRVGSQWITVAEGGVLRLDGIETSSEIPGARIEVHGSLVARNLRMLNLEGHLGVIVVRPTGAAVIDNSLLAMYSGGGGLYNDGTAVLRTVTLWSDTTPLRGAGTTTAQASVLFDCFGTNVVSLGYNAAVDDDCGLDHPTDVTDMPEVGFAAVLDPFTYEVPATFPLVDAIPVGVAGCGSTLVTDMDGDPRPVDGDGDGVAGCDIGSEERQPTPP